jgi:hypothetical protein
LQQAAILAENRDLKNHGGSPPEAVKPEHGLTGNGVGKESDDE